MLIISLIGLPSFPLVQILIFALPFDFLALQFLLKDFLQLLNDYLVISVIMGREANHQILLI